MILLVEFCKTVPGEKIGIRSGSLLNFLGNILIFDYLPIKSHCPHNDKYKEDLTKFEAMSIDVSGSSGDWDVIRCAFMRIWSRDNPEWHPGGDVEATISSIKN